MTKEELNEEIVRGVVTLVNESLRIATEHGFTDATPGEDIALMHSELSEALEDIRDGRALTETYYTKEKPDKPCGVPAELADVIIRIAHFAGKHRIDLADAVIHKAKYNESRPFRHGGKAL